MRFVNNSEQNFRDQANRNRGDFYSARIFSYAEDWANLMEERMNNGARLVDIADSTSHTADTDGITGFMYDMAVQLLVQFWEHGKELQRWHNGEYGVEDDSVVVNPAVINISLR